MAFWTIVIMVFLTQFRIARQTVIALLLSNCCLLLRRWQIQPQLGVLGVASFSALVYLLWLPGSLGQASWGAITLQAVYQGVVVAFLAAVACTATP